MPLLLIVMLFGQHIAAQSFALASQEEIEVETSNSLNISTGTSMIKINKILFPGLFPSISANTSDSKNKSKTVKNNKSNSSTIEEWREKTERNLKGAANRNAEFFGLKLFGSTAMVEPKLAIESETISSNGQLKENIVFTFPKLEDTVEDMNLI